MNGCSPPGRVVELPGPERGIRPEPVNHAETLQAIHRQEPLLKEMLRVVLTGGQPVSLLPNLLGSLAVYRVSA